MKNIKIKFGFSSIILILCAFVCKNEYTFLTFLAVVIHELGHLLAALILRIKISEFSFGILGARLKTSNCLTSYLQEIFLCAFGPIFNFISVIFVILFLDWQTSARLIYLISASILLGTLNLMPIKSFDGGRILECILSIYFSPKYVICILKVISFFFITSLWIVSVYFLLIYTSSLGLFVFCGALFCNIFIEDNF